MAVRFILNASDSWVGSEVLLEHEIGIHVIGSNPGDWKFKKGAKKANGSLYTWSELPYFGIDNVDGLSAWLSSAQTSLNSSINTHTSKTGVNAHGATATPTAGAIAVYDNNKKLKTGAAAAAPGDVVRYDELNSHTNNKSNPHAVTKAQVGLGNVDNTADSEKPVSTVQQAAISSAKSEAISAAAADAASKASSAKSEAISAAAADAASKASSAKSEAISAAAADAASKASSAKSEAMNAAQAAYNSHTAKTGGNAHGATASPAAGQIAVYDAAAKLRTGGAATEPGQVTRFEELSALNETLAALAEIMDDIFVDEHGNILTGNNDVIYTLATPELPDDYQEIKNTLETIIQLLPDVFVDERGNIFTGNDDLVFSLETPEEPFNEDSLSAFVSQVAAAIPALRRAVIIFMADGEHTVFTAALPSDAVNFSLCLNGIGCLPAEWHLDTSVTPAALTINFGYIPLAGDVIELSYDTRSDL